MLWKLQGLLMWVGRGHHDQTLHIPGPDLYLDEDLMPQPTSFESKHEF